MNRRLIDVIRASALFRDLPAEELERLAGYARFREWRGDETLARAGDAVGAFLVIIHGHVELCDCAEAPREGLLAIVGAGDVIGLEAAVRECPHETDAVALDDGHGVEIASLPYLRHIAESPAMARAALHGAAARVTALLRENADLRSKRAIDRLAAFLAELAGTPEGEVTIRLPYEKRLLAASLGISPESLSRMFNRLRPLGVITGRTDVVRIDDVARLRRGVPDGADLDAR